MKRNVLAICDPEQEYAYRLMDALGSRKDFPFEILAFTSVDKLHGAIREKPVQILLIAQSAFHAEMETWGPQIILLWEEEAGVPDGMPGISKYSSVVRIMKKITETALETGSLCPLVQTDHRVAVYGFYTPVGRCLQTTFAMTVGQLLARRRKVLYLNFESCAGLAEMLGRQGEAEFSQVLYYLQEELQEFLKRLYQAVEKVNGLDMVLPASCGFELYEIGREEWQRLLELLAGSRYEIILLDLSEGIRGLFEILRRCARIYTVVREDGFAAAKLAQYEDTLEKSEYRDVRERTRRVRLPVFSQLPRDLNHLDSGELAEFAGKVLEADERAGI